MLANHQTKKAIIQWACKQLSSLGYTLESHLSEEIQHTPWSYVSRFTTSTGYIYLKHTPALLAIEAPITQLLYKQFHAAVPEIIADNTKLHCFLMKDAGRSLRETLKQQFDTTLLCKAINQFTTLQLKANKNLNTFFELGVPDWQLDKLPSLYQQLLSEKDILKADGMSESEIIELETLLPTFSSLCEELENHPIKSTIVQCDFHDNNILISAPSQTLTFIDLGEIVISHPFFSLINCLQQAKKHHGILENDNRYQLLKNSCLKNYMAIESEKNVLTAFEIAYKLWFVYEALAQYRLMSACDKTSFLSFQRHGKLKHSLKGFVSCIVNNKQP